MQSARYGHAVEIFFDGACPLCRREVSWLRRLDREQRILLTDITASSFDARPLGCTRAELMAVIHGRLPDGQLIKGVEVFRRAYAALGLGPLVACTRLPVVSQLLDAAYSVFARNRLRMTGRCSVASCHVAPASSTESQQI